VARASQGTKELTVRARTHTHTYAKCVCLYMLMLLQGARTAPRESTRRAQGNMNVRTVQPEGTRASWPVFVGRASREPIQGRKVALARIVPRARTTISCSSHPAHFAHRTLIWIIWARLRATTVLFSPQRLELVLYCLYIYICIHAYIH